MTQPKTFNIGVDLEAYITHLKSLGNPVGQVINLSDIPDCLSFDGQQGVNNLTEFEVYSNESSVQFGLCMENVGAGDPPTGNPLFYVPNMGNFSYRNGNWFVTNVSFYTSEGNSANKDSVFGRDIGLTYSLRSGITTNEEVEFRIHFAIEFHDEENQIIPAGSPSNLVSNAVYIDPRLRVSQPPATPPPPTA